MRTPGIATKLFLAFGGIFALAFIAALVGWQGFQRIADTQNDVIDQAIPGLRHAHRLAEINALIKLDFNNPQDKSLYVTDTPCVHCAKCIVNAGIKSIVYDRRYRNDEGYLLLLDSGISLRRHSVSRDDI